MGVHVEKSATQKWLRLGLGLTFKVTEASVTAEALRPQLGSALNTTDAVNNGDLILLPIVPYLYETLDNELAIANGVMVGDSLSHLRLAPAQRLHIYWIEDLEQALCAQTYFDNLLPVQLSDRRKQLAVITRAKGTALKRLDTINGEKLAHDKLQRIAAGSLKNMLGKVTDDDIRRYREAERGNFRVSTSKKKPTASNTNAEHSSTTGSTDKPTKKHKRAQLEPELDLFAEPQNGEAANLIKSPADNDIDALAQQNWDRLGVEDSLQLSLSQILSELGATHTPAQVTKAQDLIKIYPAATHSDSKRLALQLLEDLSAQCGINIDSIKRRL